MTKSTALKCEVPARIVFVVFGMAFAVLISGLFLVFLSNSTRVAFTSLGKKVSVNQQRGQHLPRWLFIKKRSNSCGIIAQEKIRSMDKRLEHATNVTIVLEGTVVIASRDESHDLAILSVAGRAQVVGVGERIEDEILSHVYRNHVVLSRGDLSRSIFLSVATQPASPLLDPRLSKQVHRSFENTHLNLGDVITFRMKVDLSSGGLLGFYVEPNHVRRAFYDLGLRPEDLVIAINGMALFTQDVTRAEALVKDLSLGTEVVLTVSRLQMPDQNITLDTLSWTPPVPSETLANDPRH